MEYIRLLLDLLAVIGESSMISLLSPWRMQARAVPVLLFVVGMIVMVLPMLPVAALAMMLPAAWLQRFLGIDLHSHEPLNVAPAVEKARSAAQTAREKVRPSKPAEVQQFVTKAYPSPEDEAELVRADAAAVEDDDLDDEPDDAPEPTMADKLALAASGLPEQFQQQLTGQRAGRMAQPGLRGQHTVRKFVPSLG
jgi:hypothetical protein